MSKDLRKDCGAFRRATQSPGKPKWAISVLVGSVFNKALAGKQASAQRELEGSEDKERVRPDPVNVTSSYGKPWKRLVAP